MAEVIVGGEIKKDRVGNFAVVPQSYSIGSFATDLEILCDKTSKSSEVTKSKEKHNQTVQSHNAVDNKIVLGSIFYWFCQPCKISNEFLQNRCKGCGQYRTSIETHSSALLELVENVCLAHGEAEAKNGIPLIHRRSIPAGIVEAVLAQSQNKPVQVINMETQVMPDSVFYWECSHCTFNNTFRRATCKTCKRKVKSSC